MTSLYPVLEEMLFYAKRQEQERVTELNQLFEILFPKVFQNPMTELDIMYDNCRQSCLMAEKMITLRQEFLEDAIERFSKIPKP